MSENTSPELESPKEKTTEKYNVPDSQKLIKQVGWFQSPEIVEATSSLGDPTRFGDLSSIFGPHLSTRK